MKCSIKCLNGNTKINNRKSKYKIAQPIYLNNYYTLFTLENYSMIKTKTLLIFIGNYCNWLIIT